MTLKCLSFQKMPRTQIPSTSRTAPLTSTPNTSRTRTAALNFDSSSKRRRLCNVSTQVTPQKEEEDQTAKLTKAEKQRLYRLRKKKELGYEEYRRRENQRLKKYKKSMNELSPHSQRKVKLQNSIRNLRRHKKEQIAKLGKIVILDDDDVDGEDDDEDDDDDGEDDDDGDGDDDDYSTEESSVCELSLSNNTGASHISKKANSSRKRISRAVSKSNRKISKLEKNLRVAQIKYEKIKKRNQRMKVKMDNISMTGNDVTKMTDVIMTDVSVASVDGQSTQSEISTADTMDTDDLPVSPSPNTKAQCDLKSAGLNPSKYGTIKKKLIFANSIVKEVKSALKVNSKEQKKTLISKVVCGVTTKKYRCASTVKNMCGISRRNFNRVNDKTLVEKKRLRLPDITSNLRRKVSDFLCRDDNSRMNPGKKDCVKTSKNEKTQTRILCHYMHELYTKFCSENGRIMSKATFYRFRPRYILLAANLCRKTCLCTKHQNLALKLQSIRRALKEEQMSANGDIFIKEYTQQGDIDQLMEKIEDTHMIIYEEWTKVNMEIIVRKEKRMIKKWKLVRKETNAREFKNIFNKDLSIFRVHNYRVYEQYNQLKQLRENMPEDHCTVQMDFAENYTCAEESQIQSDYFGDKVQVTLHPVVSNFKEGTSLKPKSAVFISPVLKHDKSMIRAILKKLMEYLQQIKPQLKMVHYWSDSPLSQYRNRYIFDLIMNHKQYFGLSAQWNYFETGRGKGPCDGVGGTVKRMADQAIKQGRVRIQNALDMYNFCEATQKTMHYFYITENDYDEAVKLTSGKETSLKAITGTLEIHAVRKDNIEGNILVRNTSCNCLSCMNGLNSCNWKSVTLAMSQAGSKGKQKGKGKPSTKVVKAKSSKSKSKNTNPKMKVVLPSLTVKGKAKNKSEPKIVMQKQKCGRSLRSEGLVEDLVTGKHETKRQDISNEGQNDNHEDDGHSENIEYLSSEDKNDNHEDDDHSENIEYLDFLKSLRSNECDDKTDISQDRSQINYNDDKTDISQDRSQTNFNDIFLSYIKDADEKKSEYTDGVPISDYGESFDDQAAESADDEHVLIVINEQDDDSDSDTLPYFSDDQASESADDNDQRQADENVSIYKLYCLQEGDVQTLDVTKVITVT